MNVRLLEGLSMLVIVLVLVWVQWQGQQGVLIWVRVLVIRPLLSITITTSIKTSGTASSTTTINTIAPNLTTTSTTITDTITTVTAVTQTRTASSVAEPIMDSIISINRLALLRRRVEAKKRKGPLQMIRRIPPARAQLLALRKHAARADHMYTSPFNHWPAYAHGVVRVAKPTSYWQDHAKQFPRLHLVPGTPWKTKHTSTSCRHGPSCLVWGIKRYTPAALGHQSV